jgi:DNA invertase Pin-like site-specific DNA recombinase
MTSVGIEPVAAYVRMSTDHQRYSIDNQSDALAAYAVDHGMAIVRSYTDPGRSGLTLVKRPGLSRLLQDVLAGGHGFTAVLVHDVSRWGRFQDVDESAHYEFLLKRSGVRVVYCAEPFDNDGSAYASILKNMKRVMAGEFSRELSAKTARGQERLAAMGYRRGGPVGYGLRRVLVDETGKVKQTLSPGVQKSIATDRVIVRPGPPSEQRRVREVFEDFVVRGLSQLQIARRLNEAGVARQDGEPWTRDHVDKLLRNENYLGVSIVRKTFERLRRPVVRIPPNEWQRVSGMYRPIVPEALFREAAEKFDNRWRTLTDARMLDALRELLAQEGRLSQALISASPGMPSPAAYLKRFGGLTVAYALIGYQDEVRGRRAETTNRARGLRREISDALSPLLVARGYVRTDFGPEGAWLGSDGDSVAFVGLIWDHTQGCWYRNAKWPMESRLLIGRMNVANDDWRDFLALPRDAVSGVRRRVGIGDGWGRFRFDTPEAALGSLLSEAPLPL